MARIDTDYLIVGAGATGLAFADALIAACDAKVVMVDRRHAPGGHWLEAYPFVRLHQPSSYYGVNSLPLGSETIDQHGPNQGLYERATGPEICAYYRRVMEQVLLPSGRVQYFPMREHSGRAALRRALPASNTEVKVRKATVDARYLQPAVPASSAPPFEIAEGARCVPVGQLVNVAEQPDGYVIIGAGKTAMDACTWLLETGVGTERHPLDQAAGRLALGPGVPAAARAGHLAHRGGVALPRSRRTSRGRQRSLQPA